jgi:hypothetical protein
MRALPSVGPGLESSERIGMNSIFIDDQRRLRSGWRAVIFLFVFLSAAFVLTRLEQLFVLGVAADEATGETYYAIVNNAGLLFLALLIGGLTTRLFERKSSYHSPQAAKALR